MLCRTKLQNLPKYVQIYGDVAFIPPNCINNTNIKLVRKISDTCKTRHLLGNNSSFESCIYSYCSDTVFKICINCNGNKLRIKQIREKLMDIDRKKMFIYFDILCRYVYIFPTDKCISDQIPLLEEAFGLELKDKNNRQEFVEKLEEWDKNSDKYLKEIDNKYEDSETQTPLSLRHFQ